jgi:DNA invertase Pin-like site-specific DNA recombinase
MLDHLREGDTVVVWKLDRLSRSLKDVLHIMERIANAGAGFRSITENIDTTTPAGRMMMQMVGAFAEFERAMIRERTSAGLAAARAEGRVGGRKKKLDAAKRREIAESVISGRNRGRVRISVYGLSSTLRIFGLGVQTPVQKIDASAMMRTACLTGAAVRPNGPNGTYRSFHNDQYRISTRSSRPIGRSRATG